MNINIYQQTINTINECKENFLKQITKINTEEDLESLRVQYLGRKGILSSLVNKIKDLNIEEKRIIGPLINKLKTELTKEFDTKTIEIINQKLKSENYKKTNFDVTVSKPFSLHGSLHPYTQVLEHIEDVFISMGFEIVNGPEVETEFHNFDALNIPKNHPARDVHDTFWTNLPNKLMRTHTSTVQVHTMQNKKPPIAIVAPGRCYRNEATDASHDFMFMQVEGLLINKKASLANLFFTLKNFLQAIFESKNLDIRIRPGYFPFVEPGTEVDITCPFCTNSYKECSVCKKTGWIEMGGAGLVHPNVLKSGNIDPEKYSGFAFGFGLTRLVMLKYGITDIRLLHSNKIDFLKQF